MGLDTTPTPDALTASEWRKLSEWFANDRRKPAVIAFTAGACRDAATAFEYAFYRGTRSQTEE